MKRVRPFILALPLLVALTAPTVAAQSRPYTPQRGSVERQQIMDAFRVPVSRWTGRTVIFHNVRVRVQNGWAVVRTEPRTPTGQPVIAIDDRRCAPNCTEEAIGVLRWTGTQWTVVRYRVAPGELPYRWQQELPDVPRALWFWNWPTTTRG